MLDGVRSSEIIVGAYVNGEGGVCPMLAAHRRGGRTDLLAFARAWDRFTDVQGGARRATRREITVLVAHLEASLLGDASSELAHAIDEHQRLRARRQSEPPRSRERVGDGSYPGDVSRSGELEQRPGWAWLRPFRRLDDYQRALGHLTGGRASAGRAETDLWSRAAPRERQPA
jgi:hypothetical protein